ncbi:glucose-1-phosphate adenylyltransferase [Peribacillus sp. SCS-37]|uniref:glucose-1-phosphate adenylyltransferase n=1 Tax=Paraperibacillus esterisolvens TaxID=3115296 RepID=UPI0039061997
MIAMLLAGGRGSRLKALTQNLAKPAVPYGGKYRIIDFTLSNCINSGIDTVGLLTQYQPHTLQNYVSSGEIWGLNQRNGGVSILSPYQSESQYNWYEGTAHSIYQNLNFIEEQDPEYVLILSGDHIYKMDYGKMLEHHKEHSADATISVIKVPWEETDRFGIMNMDPDSSRITEFEEKPKKAKSNLASMGIYIFNWKTLKTLLKQMDYDTEAFLDFGKDVIPHMLKANHHLSAYQFDGYWKDVGTVDSFWEANLDLLSADKNPLLHHKDWPIYTANHCQPPLYLDESSTVKQSLISEGCEIHGHIQKSVLSHGVKVGKGSIIRNSVLLPDAVVGENVRIENAVIGSGAVIKSNIGIGTATEVTLVGEKEVVFNKKSTVRKGA